MTKAGLVEGEDGVRRCFWAAGAPEYAAYHDHEWGFPVSDDTRLFEKVCLEGFQAGLSWLTILRKREGFRHAFGGFEIARVARFNRRSVERLLQDASIVRHRGKIEATIHNAKRALEVVDEFGSLSAYFWRYEPPPRHRPRRITRATLAKLGQSPASVALSQDLKKRGFRFVGPTTMYALMQAMGLVNDHLEGCAVRGRAKEARERFSVPG